MDYEKKYKEALSRAKHALDCDRNNLVSTDIPLIYSMFPELKESEDERIRKAIHIYLDWLDGRKDYAPKSEYSIKDMIAWLEKQGKSYTKKDVDNAFVEGMAFAKDELEKQIIDVPKWKYKKDHTPLLRDSIILNKYGGVAKSPSGAIISGAWILDYDELIKLPKEELEKQNEQKPFDKYEELTDFERTLADICIGWIGEEIGWKQYIKDNADILLKIAIEKFNSIQDAPFEQNHANKVEPKFKNGQWIVWQDKYYKVSYNGCGYELVDQNGLSTSLEYDTIDENARLWTIQDAKDGDVLAWDNSKCIALFKNIYDKDSFVSHALVGYYTEVFEPRRSYHNIKGTHPATKEQRNLLFVKMREAGYEWNAEKKKLNKIEPKDYRSIDPHFFKTAEKVEPKFKIGDWIVCEGLNTALIVNIDDDKYEVEFIDGNKGFPHIDYIDRKFHLWTIQDAKDGDVLISGGVIFTFNKIHGVWVDCYCCLFNDGSFDIMKHNLLHIKYSKVYPATKEQCDTLMKAITDAGYEFALKDYNNIDPHFGKLID